MAGLFDGTTRVVTSSVLVAGYFLCFAWPPTGGAAEYDGVRFADTVSVEGELLTLRGMGEVKWMRLFSVYVGALYMPERVSSKDVLEPIPKRLEFRYWRDISREQLVEAGDVFLRRNLTADEFSRISDEVDAINALYRDVGDGDRYSLTYLPGKGTTLALNGQLLGTIEGEEFAAQYYRLWLGERPLSEGFKNDLLGGGRPVDLRGGGR